MLVNNIISVDDFALAVVFGGGKVDSEHFKEVDVQEIVFVLGVVLVIELERGLGISGRLRVGSSGIWILQNVNETVLKDLSILADGCSQFEEAH